MTLITRIYCPNFISNMAEASKTRLKGKFWYHLSKIAPMNTRIPISLTNGLKFIIRARTMDKSVLKEVWIKSIYHKYGIGIEEGDTVVDIGAHIGLFSIYASSLSKTGKVYAFEPFPKNFEKLKEHKDLNHQDNLLIFNKAIADKEGVETLYLSPDNNTGGHSLHLKTQTNAITAQVETLSLASFCKNEHIDRIDYLKIDCEGAEFNILQSGESILQRVKKLVLECHPHGDNTVDSMIELLDRQNFEVTREINNSPSGNEMLYCINKAL